MPDSLKASLIADLLLARRLESTDAWVSLLSAQIHAQLYPGSGALAEPVAGVYAVFTGVGSPLTQAIGLGMKGPVTGVQKTIILTLLSHAVEGGCDVAYTLTRPGSVSQRNVERQHFYVAYTRAMMVKEVEE
jgi:multidrug transporter EmrE-like cation transporter